MTKTLLSLLMIFMSLLVFGVTNVRKGTPYQVEDAQEKYYFSQDGEMLTIKIRGRFVILQKFNTVSLKEISSKEFEHFPKPFVIESVCSFNERYFVFFSVWDKKEHLEQLYFQEISFEAGNFIGKPQRILSSNIKVTGFYSSAVTINGFIPISIGGGVRNKFHFNISNDNSKLLIQYRLTPEHKSDKINYDKIGIHVFDKDINEIWGKVIKMPYTEKTMNNLDYSVDSEGNAYILTMVYNSNSTKEKVAGEVNYHVEMLKILNGSGDIEKIKVGLDDKMISTIWIFETSDDYMTCAGFYNDNGDGYDANGIFTFKMNKNGDVTDKRTHPIPIELVNMYSSKKTQEKNIAKGRSEFQNLELTQLVNQEDGSVVIVGEQSYSITTTYVSSNGTTKQKTTYYYNDMLVTKIDASGELAWMKKLPKRQQGQQGVGGMSYYYTQDESKNIHMLYLDNKKNLELRTDQVPATHMDGAGGFLTDYRIDINTGEYKKQNYFDIKDVDGMKIYQFTPDRIEYVGDDKCVIEVYKKEKEDILLEIKLIK